MNCLKIVAKTGMHQAINCGDLILSMPIQYKPVNSSDSKLPKHSLPMAILIYWNCDIYWDSKPLYEGLLTRKHRHLSHFYDIMVLHATCIILNTILVDTSLLSSAYFSGILFVVLSCHAIIVLVCLYPCNIAFWSCTCLYSWLILIFAGSVFARNYLWYNFHCGGWIKGSVLISPNKCDSLLLCWSPESSTLWCYD